MSMIDLIVVLIIVVIVGAAIRYIIRQKKKGVKCIGCPQAGTCSRCGHHDAKASHHVM